MIGLLIDRYLCLGGQLQLGCTSTGTSSGVMRATQFPARIFCKYDAGAKYHPCTQQRPGGFSGMRAVPGRYIKSGYQRALECSSSSLIMDVYLYGFPSLNPSSTKNKQKNKQFLVATAGCHSRPPWSTSVLTVASYGKKSPRFW